MAIRIKRKKMQRGLMQRDRKNGYFVFYIT